MRSVFVLFICISFFSELSFCQERTSEWKEFVSDKGLNVFYKYTNCDPSIGYDTESILLWIQNTTAKKILVDWNMEIFYAGKCSTCQYGDEYNYRYIIDPNQSLKGSCGIDSDSRLRIFSKFIDPQYKLDQNEFTKFNFANFKVTVLDF